MTEPRPTVFDDILDLALARDGARRATLVRVLVDGFIRDPEPRSHRERKQFEELMVNLIGSVDAFTRAVVAQKLARRSDVPTRVVDFLLAGCEEIVEPLLASSPPADRQRAGPVETNSLAPVPRKDLPDKATALLDLNAVPRAGSTIVPPKRSTAPTFLDATPAVRRALIERLAEADPGGRHAIAPSPATATLLRHAVLRQRGALAATLAGALGVSTSIAQRIIDDPDGEPFVLAARALSLPEEAFTQLLLLANPVIGQSYDKVKSLQALYAATRVGAARAIVASLAEDNMHPRHQPVLSLWRSETGSTTGSQTEHSTQRGNSRSATGS